MAKELPYFKFEPGAFDAGRIQMCSMEAQGLFVNICCIYWSRLGDLPEKLAMQKLCRSYADAYAELLEEHVISIREGLIIIDFLDEQLSDAGEKSNKAKDAAKARWDKYRQKKAESEDSMRSHNERNANEDADAMPIEEKRKEKKKREEKRHAPEALTYPFEDDLFIDWWATWKVYKKEQHRFTYKSHMSEQAALMDLQKKSDGDLITAIEIIKQSIAQGYKGLFELKQSNNGQGQKSILGLTEEERIALARNKDI